MNLIRDPWLPVRLQNGQIVRIAPWQITQSSWPEPEEPAQPPAQPAPPVAAISSTQKNTADTGSSRLTPGGSGASSTPNSTAAASFNPVVAISSPRPDFDAALMQFLIGLLHTCYPNKSPAEWVKWLLDPPSPDVLRQDFEPYAATFDSQNFMQDYELCHDQSKTSPYGDGASRIPNKAQTNIYEKNANKARPDKAKSKKQAKNEQKDIATLLIPFPGQQTLKYNVDHFIKRESGFIMCAPCAITALFTLQTNAPSGGQGHRTSLRGGGPLTTLVSVDSNPQNANSLPDTLWHNIWLNVLTQEGAPKFCEFVEQYKHKLPGEPYSNPDIFPWLAPTRTSEDKSQHVQMGDPHFHPLQVYWNLPRRICICWQSNKVAHQQHSNSNQRRASSHAAVITHQQVKQKEAPNILHHTCSLCGQSTPAMAKTFITKPRGVKYEDISLHPLTPHKDISDKKTQGPALNPQKVQPSGIPYTHWPDIALKHNGKLRPAAVVTRYHELQRRLEVQLRLHSFGYDMDNMKARAWHEVKMPLFQVNKAASFEERVRNQLVAPASECAIKLQQQIGQAFKGDAKVTLKSPPQVKKEFFQKTQGEFFQTLTDLNNICHSNSIENASKPTPPQRHANTATPHEANDANEANEKTKKQELALADRWIRRLRQSALEVFDAYTAIDYNLRPKQIRRTVTARKNLELGIKKLYNLNAKRFP